LHDSSNEGSNLNSEKSIEQNDSELSEELLEETE
jgi:hypothetical protein